MSACFLRLLVCDVIQFRDEHARMRINDPLAIGVYEGDNNRVTLVCPILKLLLSILRHVLGDESLEQGIVTLWIGCRIF